MVALRKESVDRNMTWGAKKYATTVALRKESVDRNLQIMPLVDLQTPSLSARRAWIEIILFIFFTEVHKSLSARRAWIEIRRIC